MNITETMTAEPDTTIIEWMIFESMYFALSKQFFSILNISLEIKSGRNREIILSV